MVARHLPGFWSGVTGRGTGERQVEKQQGRPQGSWCRWVPRGTWKQESKQMPPVTSGVCHSLLSYTVDITESSAHVTYSIMPKP